MRARGREKTYGRLPLAADRTAPQKQVKPTVKSISTGSHVLKVTLLLDLRRIECALQTILGVINYDLAGNDRDAVEIDFKDIATCDDYGIANDQEFVILRTFDIYYSERYCRHRSI